MKIKVLNNDSANLSIVRYEVRGNPLFEAVQAPSEKKIRVRGIFGPGIMISKSINIMVSGSSMTWFRMM